MLVQITVFFSISQFMFHGTFYNSTLLFPFLLPVKRNNEAPFLKNHLNFNHAPFTLFTKEEMMLWTLGRCPGQGIEIDRGVSRMLSNSASNGIGKENAVYRFQ